jgi:hypothetical protein
MTSFLTAPPSCTTPPRWLGILAVALVFAVTGCDSSGGLQDAPDADDAVVSAEETAESIAFSVAEETGGTVEDLGSAAGLLQARTGLDAKSFSRNRSCEYDDEAMRWTCEASVERENPRISSSLSRSYQVQFFDGETPVRFPGNADSLTYALQEGSGSVEGPRIENEHTLLPATWSIARTATPGEFTVRLVDDTAGRDVEEEFSGAVRERSRTAQIRKTSVDALTWRRGTPGRPVDGTIEGTYDADVEITRANGSTLNRTVSVSYVVTFSEDGAEVTFEGSGERFNGESFSFDPVSGETTDG